MSSRKVSPLLKAFQKCCEISRCNSHTSGKFIKELDNNVLYISDADMEEEDSALISRFLSSKQAHGGIKAIYLTRIEHGVSAAKQRMKKKSSSSHSDPHVHRASILSFENNKLFRALIDCISKCHSLEALTIIGVHIPPEFLAALGNAIYQNDSRLFRSLAIKNNHLRDEGLRILTPYLAKSKIQVMILENLNLTDASCNYLASILKAQEAAMDTLYWNSTLRVDSALDDGYATTDTYGLQALSLRGNQITSSGVIYIAKFLRSNQWLLSVNFACNQIDVEGVVHLARALENNTTLHTIVLAGNPGYNDKIGQTLDETASVAHSKLDMKGKSEYDSFAVGEVRPCVAAYMVLWLNMTIQKELLDELDKQKKGMGYGRGYLTPKGQGRGNKKQNTTKKLLGNSSSKTIPTLPINMPEPQDIPLLMDVKDFELIESLDLGSVDSELRGQTKTVEMSMSDKTSFRGEDDDDEEIWRAHTKNINFQNDEVDEMLRQFFANSGESPADIAKMAETSGSLYTTLAQDRMGELAASDVGSSIEIDSSIASDGAVIAPPPPMLSVITGTDHDYERPQTHHSSRPNKSKVAPPVRSISPATLPSTLTSPTQADEQYLIDSQNIPAFAFGIDSNEKRGIVKKSKEIKFESDGRPSTSRGSRGSTHSHGRSSGNASLTSENAVAFSSTFKQPSVPLSSYAQTSRTVTISTTPKSALKSTSKSFLEKAKRAAGGVVNTRRGTGNLTSKDFSLTSKRKGVAVAAYLSPKALATGAVNAFKYKSILKKPTAKGSLHEHKRSLSASVDSKFAATSAAAAAATKVGFGRSVNSSSSSVRKSGAGISTTTTPRGTMTRMSARKVTLTSSSVRPSSAPSSSLSIKGKTPSVETPNIAKRNNRVVKEYSKYGVTQEYASRYISPSQKASTRKMTPRNSLSYGNKKASPGSGNKRSPVEHILNNLEEGVVQKINSAVSEVTANLQEVSRQLVLATDSLSKARESPVMMSGGEREMNDEVMLGNGYDSDGDHEYGEEEIEENEDDIDEDDSQKFSLSETVQLNFEESPNGTMNVIGKRANSPNVHTGVKCSNSPSDGAREVVKIKGGKIFNLNGEKLDE